MTKKVSKTTVDETQYDVQNEVQSDEQNEIGTTAVAVVKPSSVVGMTGFKVARRITMPVLNPKVNEPIVVRINDAFHESSYKGPEANKEKPATVCSVTDMQTGVESIWLVNEVAYKNITEQYPDDSYIGRIFGVQKLPKRPGKRYFDFEVVELIADE